MQKILDRSHVLMQCYLINRNTREEDPENQPYEIINGKGIIPEGTKVVRTDVFRGRTDLTSVVLPASVKQIAAGVFLGCTNLEMVKLPKGTVRLEFTDSRRTFTITEDYPFESLTLEPVTQQGLIVKLLRKDDIDPFE